MTPVAFDYVAPESIDEVLALLADDAIDTRVIAGGQSLFPMLAFRLAGPDLLIDLNRIPGLSGITADSSGVVRIGAMTRTRDIERSGLVRASQPLLAAGPPHIAHVAIRNRGTIGGSLCHADPAAEFPALALACGARIETVSATGGRRISASDFFEGVFTTALEEDEIVAAIQFPAWPAARRWAFLEVSRRHGDFALAGCAFWADVESGGVCTAARMVQFGVSDRPLVLDAVEMALVGSVLIDRRTADAAAAAAFDTLDPDTDIHASGLYRKELGATLARRAVLQAAGVDWKAAA